MQRVEVITMERAEVERLIRLCVAQSMEQMTGPLIDAINLHSRTMEVEHGLLSPAEAAKVLGVRSTDAVAKYRRDKNLPAVEVGKDRYRYRHADLVEWMKGRSTQTPARTNH